MLNIGSIPVWMGYIIFAIGVGFLALIGALLIVSVQDFIKSCIDSFLWNYKFKHRFDKPPMAKCYCKDCANYGKNGRYHDSTDNRCFAHAGWYVAENWFCWNATPCEKDPNKEVHK